MAERLKHKKGIWETKLCPGQCCQLDVTMTSFRTGGMTERNRLEKQASLRVSPEAPAVTALLFTDPSHKQHKLQALFQSLIGFHLGPSNRVHTAKDLVFSLF